MADLGFRPFDADNHYYEAEDAFTRHVDRRMQHRAVEWVERNGRQRILVAGNLDRFIPNPTFDPVTRPGVLEDYFRGVNPSGKTQAELFAGNLEPIRPEYRDRDARLRCMDDQGLDKVMLFPTLGCGLEDPMRADAEATHAMLHGFNQWLEEDWGFDYQGRIFSVPMLSLMDVDRAVEQLEWVLERGARMVYLRPGPVPKEHGSASPGLPENDPFWARINEAGVTVAFHAADSGQARALREWEPFGPMESFRGGSTFNVASQNGRAIMDTMAALICHGVFDRFPNVRVCSIENGSFWVPWLFKNLAKAFGQMPKSFREDPRETFKRHVWVAPFFENDVSDLLELVGANRVLFGSDWPHAEGLAAPMNYLAELEGFSPKEVRQVMLENIEALTTPGVAP